MGLALLRTVVKKFPAFPFGLPKTVCRHAGICMEYVIKLVYILKFIVTLNLELALLRL